MIGVLNIYKEKGYTSFSVVAAIRKITGEKKVGHTGTLDPDAEGVLPVCVGKATKLVDQLTDTDKEYEAVMQLGIKTDTQDMTGRVLEEKPLESFAESISDVNIISAFESLSGDIMQLPPMYSALKVGGVKLVDAARKGREIERTARKVTVYGYSAIKYYPAAGEVFFRISCSKGTYVRTICQDIGDILGVPACLKKLKRTRAAGFTADKAFTVAEIRELSKKGLLEEALISVDSLLPDYRKLTVNEASLRLIDNGCLLEKDNFDGFPGAGDGEIFKVYDSCGRFCAIYRYDCGKNIFRPEKMFI